MLDNAANICVMPEDIATRFVKLHGWTIRTLKRPVHMGAVSHGGIVSLRDIIVNPHNKYQQPFYLAPKGTMTICTTDYISRLGLFYVILPHQEGFLIRDPGGKILFRGQIAPDKFHYIDWDIFNGLCPADPSATRDGIAASDMEEYIGEVC
jgi:hypothetical protein